MGGPQKHLRTHRSGATFGRRAPAVGLVACAAAGLVASQDSAQLTYREAVAEEEERIELSSGEQLTGDVVAVDARHVVILHGPLGERKVPIAKIVSVVGRDVHVITADGEELDVTIEQIADGKLVVHDGMRMRSLETATLRSEPAGIRLSGTMTVGTSTSIGDKVDAGATGDVDIVAKRDDDRVTGKLDWSYRETKDRRTYEWRNSQRRTRGEVQYDHFALEDVFFWANSSALNDEFADVELQWITGAGAGYELVKEKNVSLSASAGLAWVKMDFIRAEDREFPAGRGALSFSWTPAPRVKLIHDSSVAPSLKHGDDVDDVLVRLDTRLRWTVVDKLFAQIRWVVDHNEAPSPGFETTDQLVSLNMGWSF